MDCSLNERAANAFVRSGLWIRVPELIDQPLRLLNINVRTQRSIGKNGRDDKPRRKHGGLEIQRSGRIRWAITKQRSTSSPSPWCGFPLFQKRKGLFPAATKGQVRGSCADGPLRKIYPFRQIGDFNTSGQRLLCNLFGVVEPIEV